MALTVFEERRREKELAAERGDDTRTAVDQLLERKLANMDKQLEAKRREVAQIDADNTKAKAIHQEWIDRRNAELNAHVVAENEKIRARYEQLAAFEHEEKGRVYAACLKDVLAIRKDFNKVGAEYALASQKKLEAYKK